ncbi:uncharacterized protein LOC125238788 [Leguminivora glycinivorella]|uniref:uncharacterized protein LOC125238788 n=1 Tax=Leguminivora glycinivorella TaxID=1035111 RepID=UPI00200DF485|nr:uncharacterized protein LOC125238788 [Leguminivora glycinivorella]
MCCRCHLLGVFYFLKEIIKMTYRFFLIFCLQVLCQNAHSQAITPALEPTEVTITEAIIETPLEDQPLDNQPLDNQPLDNQPLDNQPLEPAPATDNQQYGPCGLPIHLCKCNQQPAVPVTEGTTVAQTDAAPSVCPQCGLSADLCKCDQEVAQPKLCPNCGRPVELCICGSPSVVAETEENKPQSLCPVCGRPKEYCLCGVLLVVAPKNAVGNQPNNGLCQRCGRPLALCLCGKPAVAISPVVETSPVFEGTSFIPQGTSAKLQITSPVEITSADGKTRMIVCPKCGRSVELCMGPKESSVPQMCPHCGHPIEMCMCGAHHHHH